jgi:hypothetical protein
MFNIASFVLLALVVLAPLGGQASIQILTLKNQTVSVSQPFAYMNMAQTSLFGLGGDFGSELPALNSLYTASLITPASVRNSPLDLWGNVKIPNMVRLDGFTAGSSAWNNVPEHNVFLFISDRNSHSGHFEN